jgi:hypothetical protein
MKNMPGTKKQSKKEMELANRLRLIQTDLVRIQKALKKNTDYDTWKWAAMEIFKELQQEFPDAEAVEVLKARALHIARECEAAQNFCK